MSRVLVVGASGLLGRNICEALGDTAKLVRASRKIASRFVGLLHGSINGAVVSAAKAG